jgi:signal peptidase II
LYWLVGLMIILFDQVSKYLISIYMMDESYIQLIPGFLTVFQVHNPGVAFGLLANQRIFVIIFTLLVLAVLVINRKKLAKEPNIIKWGIILAASGAVGNLIDRLRLGYVVDFIYMPLIPVFNVFNLADMGIVFGVGLIIIDLVFLRQKSEKDSGEKSEKVEGNGEYNRS